MDSFDGVREVHCSIESLKSQTLRALHRLPPVSGKHLGLLNPLNCALPLTIRDGIVPRQRT